MRIVLRCTIGLGFFSILCLLNILCYSASANEWPEATAEAWPEADRLFRSDPSWRGGDGASSVDLGDNRIYGYSVTVS